MDEVRHLEVVRGVSVERATLTFGPRKGVCHVELRLDNGSSWTSDQFDYFESLMEIRRALESEGAFILCQGSRRDVWPSGMARSMGAGLRAYVLVAGIAPTMDDLVGIFEPAGRSLIGTIAEQEATRDSWFTSRGLRLPPSS